MPKRPRIITATHMHADVIAPLLDAYRRFYGETGDIGLALAFVNARLERNDSVIFLAMRDTGVRDAAIGFAQLYPTFSTVSLQPAWVLNDLYVDPEHRRFGVGKLLVDRSIAHAETTGAAYLSLETAADNAPARLLYDELGFRTDDEVVHYTRRFPATVTAS